MTSRSWRRSWPLSLALGWPLVRAFRLSVLASLGLVTQAPPPFSCHMQPGRKGGRCRGGGGGGDGGKMGGRTAITTGTATLALGKALDTCDRP